MDTHLEVVEKREGFLHVRLRGDLNETFHPTQSFGEVPRALRVDCAAIQSINSIGILRWVRFFGDLAKRGVSMTFAECSIATIEHIELLSNFLAGGKVESMTVPYQCGKCHEDFNQRFDAVGIVKMAKAPEIPVCPKCGSAESELLYLSELVFARVAESV